MKASRWRAGFHAGRTGDAPPAIWRRSCSTRPMLTYARARTPAEFDAGYANSIDAAVVEKWEAVFREKSREVLASDCPRQELVYGPDARHRIDFFPAAGAPPGAPVLIAIHGGLWFLFDRWMMHFLVPAFTAAGVHVACPSYRLAPQAGLDDIVADCRQAVAFLHRQRGALGIATSPFAVLGHSAAGQLAAVMAATDWPAFDPQLPTGLLQHLVGVSGFYDIEPFAHTGFHAFTRFAPEAYARWNPVNLVRPGQPASLLITGGRESALLHEMMDGYAALLGAAGTAVEVRDVTGECHFSVLALIGDASSALHATVLAALR